MVDLRERFYCACCDVVFKERWPVYADRTPCLACDCTSICLSDVRYGFRLDETTICELYDL
jgi:hypothetical protein